MTGITAERVAIVETVIDQRAGQCTAHGGHGGINTAELDKDDEQPVVRAGSERSRTAVAEEHPADGGDHGAAAS